MAELYRATSVALLAFYLSSAAGFSVAPTLTLKPVTTSAEAIPPRGQLRASRRDVLAAIGLSVFAPMSDVKAKTPVRAPLPPGPPNPADKQKLIDTEVLIEGWGSTLKDPASWPSIVDAIEKPPLAPDSLDELFRYAAKNLPANNLLGTDAGQWAGLKVESVQAMESFASEITYLAGESKKGSKNIDTTDLIGYHTELVAKMKDFIALYDNKKSNKYLPQLKENSE